MIWAEIFLYSLLFLLLLHIIGHPVLKMIERVGGIHSTLVNLDSIQKLPIEFVLGGTVIYIWALIASPFQLFNYTSCIALTVVFGILYLAVTFARHGQLHEIGSFKLSVYSFVAVGVFIFALALRILPLPGITLGSVNDSALHTLFVYAIIQHGGIPQSIPVVAPVVLQFPQGLHVVLAYFAMLSRIPPELVVFYELAYFNATIVISAYLFCSVVVGKEYALIVELLLAGISVSPISITWGAQIIPWSLTIFFVVLALVLPTYVAKEQFKFDRSTLRVLLFPGILLGYLGAVYAPLLIILAFIFFIVAVAQLRDLTGRIASYVVLTLLSLPLFAIWVYRFLFLSNFTSSFLFQETTNSNNARAYIAGLQWFPFKEMTSLSGIAKWIWNWMSWPSSTRWPGSLEIFPALLIIGSGLFVLALFSKNHFLLPKVFLTYVVSVFIAVLIWGANTPVGLFYYTGGPFFIITPELDKVAILTGTFLLPFIAALPLYLVITNIPKLSRLSRSYKRKYIAAAVIGGLLVANFAIVPSGLAWLNGNYGVFAVTSSSDYQLLQWMRDGIPQNSTVLINPYDAGQYVASVSNKSVVGMYTGIAFPSSAYENLTLLLANGIMNSTTTRLLGTLGVNYIFVGSKAFQTKWSPRLFINHCLTFKAVASYGNSYLFQIVSLNPASAKAVCQYI